jgi:hypothetical protein
MIKVITPNDLDNDEAHYTVDPDLQECTGCQDFSVVVQKSSPHKFWVIALNPEHLTATFFDGREP